MKKTLSYGLLTLLILLAVYAAGAAASYPITDAILQARAWTFTALQTFSGGVGLPGATTYLNDGTAALLPVKADFTMANPAAAPTGMTTGSIGSCTSAETYRLYVLATNQSGETALSPASTDYTPTGASRRILTVSRPSLAALATHWRLLYSKQSEAHATVRACTNPAIYLTAATSSTDCSCVAGGPTYTNLNTSGLFTFTDIRDGEIRFAQTGSPIFTAGGNRLSFGANSSPTWSRNSGANVNTMALLGPQTKEVCVTGCQYTTIPAALAAITDASSIKRYTVLIHPGDYDEPVSTKSWITFMGVNRDTVRLRGGTSTATDIDGIEFNNLTIGGRDAPFSIGAGSGTRRSFRVLNCIVGITDGTEGAAGKTIDGILDTNATSNRDYIVQNTIFISNFDFIRVGGGSTYLGMDNVYIGTPSSEPFLDVYGASGDGFTIVDVNPRIILQAQGSTVAAAVYYTAPIGSAADSIRVINGEIKIFSTDATRTGASACFWLTNSNGGTERFSFLDTSCEITMADGGSTIRGIFVQTVDADRANTLAEWRGGEIRMSGGASRTDIVNDETTGGFVLRFGNVLHGGSYSGSGTNTFLMSPMTNGQWKNSAIASAPSTCSIGDFYADTSGAACFCKATNVWEDMTDAVVGVGGCV